MTHSTHYRTLSISDYGAVIFAREEELCLKKQGKPYSELVIDLCDMWLRCFPHVQNQYVTQSLQALHNED